MVSAALRKQDIENFFVRLAARLRFEFCEFSGSEEIHADFDQISDHRIDIAANVADFSEFAASTLTNGILAMPAMRRAISSY